MFESRPQELGRDEQNNLTARGKASIQRRSGVAKRRMRRADARSGERSIRGRRGGVACDKERVFDESGLWHADDVTWSILPNWRLLHYLTIGTDVRAKALHTNITGDFSSLVNEATKAIRTVTHLREKANGYDTRQSHSSIPVILL